MSVDHVDYVHSSLLTSIHHVLGSVATDIKSVVPFQGINSVPYSGGCLRQQMLSPQLTALSRRAARVAYGNAA